MKKYILLLRGINVGGNNIIKMADLKSCLEENGYINVVTYIQSGNVILESNDSISTIINNIERVLSKKFNYESKVVLVDANHYKKVIENAPKWWGKDKDFKHNLLFIKEPVKAEDALKEIGGAKEEIEFAEAGNGVVYVSSSIKHLTKTNFVKVVGKPIYKSMTIRNYNTCMKLLALIEK
jgi:uncharacterized protein (DUF1697 family)